MVLTSVQTALLDDDIFPNNQPVGGHFSQLGENAADVFVGVNERDDDRQLASGFYKVRGANFAASEEAGYGVEGYGSEDIFFAQVFQDFEMQRTMMQGIALGEIDGDLNGHNYTGCHFTARGQVLLPRGRRLSRARCWPQC